MGAMGIAALYAAPKTSRPGRDQAVYPYLPRGLDIVRSDQVWQVDITNIKLPVGFAYLVALIDVHNRRIMGWRLSNSMSQTFCLDALEDALTQGVADIVNSDQGARFTAKDWISALEERGVRVSILAHAKWVAFWPMPNGWQWTARAVAWTTFSRLTPRHWRDGPCEVIERFWRTIKYEKVYLRVYESLPEARRCIDAYIDF